MSTTGSIVVTVESASICTPFGDASEAGAGRDFRLARPASKHRSPGREAHAVPRGKLRQRAGLRVPTAGEAAWLTRDGRKPYWRAAITALACEFAL
ncbi:MAG: hypothetical protein KIT28_12550 [Rubrivivax sp.]|nr:hypothetical protein [Rubrivivax sp.]